jgi:hypothetical protein
VARHERLLVRLPSSSDTGWVLGLSERRVLRLSADANETRRVLRSQLVPVRDGIPSAWFGRELRPGVRGWVIGRLVLLGVAPPGRTLWSNRNSPVFLGRVVDRADGGSDIRVTAYSRGFPYRTSEDPPARAAFDEWLHELSSDLGAP